MMSSQAINAALSQDALLDKLRLIRSENVGPVTYLTLIRQFGSAKAALEAIPSLAAGGGKRKPTTCFSKKEAEEEIEKAQAAGARFVCMGDAEYPTLLASIYDAPPVLTVLGHPHLWQRKRSLAIVGARNASAAGCQFARKLAQDAGQRDFIIASGLARGIDTAAHTGSLQTGTIAVMASGIGQVYPPENKALHDSIAQQGCIITEQPFNAQPHSRAFPGRNRIIAGLSVATIIVEAALKSGSLITARFALDQGRDVFAVPGSPLDPRCKGTNQLIKQGANLCESIEDVISNLSPHPRLNLSEAIAHNYQAAPQQPVSDSERAEARKIITQKLSFTPVQIDELLNQCQLPHHLLSLILLELELAGRLQRHPGHKVSLKAEET